MFAFSFVLFGVGNAGGLSFFDYLTRNSGSASGGTTTSSPTDTKALLAAQAGVKKAPKDAQLGGVATAWTQPRERRREQPQGRHRELPGRRQGSRVGRQAEAEPDITIEKALAAAYTSEASGYQAAYSQVAQQASDVQAASPNSSQFVPTSAATALDPFTQAEQSIVSKQASDLQQQALPLYTNASDSSKKALDVYLKITKLTPNDAVNWFNMAEAAQGAGDTANAIKGYQEFLRILGDPLAPQVKTALAQLQPKPKTSTTTTPTPTTSTATAPTTTG